MDATLRSIADALPQHVHRLRRWCEMNSGTGNLSGLEKVEAELIAALKPLSGEIQSIPLSPANTVDSRGQIVEQPLGRAIRCVNRPDAPLRVLLNIHYDTVYEADHPFQTVEQVDADTIRGPGVADAKGGIVVLLAAIVAFEHSPLRDRVGFEILLNPDEEIGSPGSAQLLAQAAGRNHLGLVFEPAFCDGAIVDSRKGSGTITAVVRGRAAHVGRDFAAGRSAILALADFIARVDAAQNQSPGITINCGRIEGGAAINIVPDLAIGRFNVRATTPDDQQVVERIFASAARDIGNREGITIQLHGGFTSPPKPLDDRSATILDHLLACGRELGMNLSHRPSGGTCDGNKLAAAGLPVIDSLGPVGGDLHSDREWVRVSSITQRAQLVASFLLKLASGDVTI